MIQTRQPDYLIAIFFCEYVIAIFTNTKKSQKEKKDNRERGCRSPLNLRGVRPSPPSRSITT
jgi:hypothetical protein